MGFAKSRSRNLAKRKLASPLDANVALDKARRLLQPKQQQMVVWLNGRSRMPDLEAFNSGMHTESGAPWRSVSPTLND
ncbi:hypothetical protein CEXT_147991 [Caerostris extrusa]|uniref:Uncharacterized protein n=1 Tax=Caerostris extrusa TaxID=172846 RepID=A0AAV4RWJ2_CAEEX|nr:hypothetical protein CEXT_147991 [Caerostris extrusa]